MKKNIKLCVLAMTAVLYLLTGCAPKSPPLDGDGRFQIVCTTFPQYGWVVNLVQGNEENGSVTLRMDKGGDLHNFQPSVLEIVQEIGRAHV